MNTDERKFIPVTEFAAQSNRSLHREERKAQLHKSLYLEEIIRTGTRMLRIKRIFTDPCASASSAQSVFYRTPPIIDDDKKPQINADKRRFVNRAPAFHKFPFIEQIENHENHSN